MNRTLKEKDYIRYIKEIIELDISDEGKWDCILTVISRDENAIPFMLKLLSIERKINKEVLTDCNEELSIAILHIEKEKISKDDRKFLSERWKTFYNNWKDCLSYGFANAKFLKSE